MKAPILALTLSLVTGCGTLLPTQTASQSNQAAQPKAAPLNATPSAQRSPRVQRFSSDQQQQIANHGYRDGYEDGSGGFPSSPSVGMTNLTDPAEQKIYTDAYNNGYTDGRGQQPSPSPSLSPSPTPTSTVSPDRRAELQRQGYQEGARDAQSGFASNPESGIAVLGLTAPAEKQIYTIAYNSGYQGRPSPSPSPSPTLSPGLLAQLRQEGYNDGYADAQSSFTQDASRGINLRGLVTAAERRAYTNGYNRGYQDQGAVVGGW